jgi:hypothetical protein
MPFPDYQVIKKSEAIRKSDKAQAEGMKAKFLRLFTSAVSKL